ncbi:MAG: hypothetical protein A3G18_04700 [Rhodospirillales bacterium RIFCSPLOWO2_12_FULL_58_28]|nr:MAG: hypothetical protein A3H92_09490 [Rhodospirillales bacterium RIFCSPLOWO2_02_FULL_58_16]OHC76939.1 MAG: hypothetical protein A3G18_04700 [Rhodospirillales bacterium RIFCSPLOWO2_12_FULL_58_28]
MRPEFIQLDRKFVKYDPGQDQEGIAARSYLSDDFLSHDSKWTWEKLLDHGRVVVLGEAGSGKTWELEAQVDRLASTDKYAFFVRLENLAENELTNILSEGSLARFNEWKNSTVDAYFFLDAVDESRLKNFHAFERALGSFARSLGYDVARARTVISSRVTEWRGEADSTLIKQHLPVSPKKTKAASAEPGTTQVETADASANGFAIYGEETFANKDGADKPQPVLVVQIAPLQQDQVRKLAAARIKEADAFVEAIKNRDIWSFARRPLDVEDLIAYWAERIGLGSLSDLQEFSVTRKLNEPNQRRTQDDPLDRTRAQEGAETLAAAAILAKKLSFAHPESSMTGTADNSALDPKHILPTWKTGELKALFARPLFDGAAFEKVRFHHRKTIEYLAACWFSRLVEANLPLVGLHRLIFLNSHGLRVIPPSLAPVAAWLAGWFPTIRKVVLETDPDILLLHGDPSLIPLPERITLLQRLVDRKVRRLDSFDPAQFLRLADPGLAPYIAGVLLDPDIHDEACELMLDMVRHGRLIDCAEAVLTVATKATTHHNPRYAAILTLKEVGSSQQLQTLADAALAGPPPGATEAAILCRTLYPCVIDEAGLEMLIRLAQPSSSSTFGGIDYTLKEIIRTISMDRLPALMALLVRLSREEPWVQGAAPQCLSKVSYRFLWVYEPLLVTVQRILHTDGYIGLTSVQIAEAIERLSRLRRYNSNYRNNKKPLQDDLNAHPEVRRRLYWRRVEKLPQRNDDDQILHYMIADYDDLWYLAERDFTWLLNDVTTAAAIKDRIIALRVVLQMWRRTSNRSPRILRDIRRAARRERELRQVYRRENPNGVKRIWQWTHGKIDHLRRFGLPNHWRHKARNEWTRFRIFLGAIRYYHALRTKGHYGLLHNLILVDQYTFETSYGKFDIDAINRRYGSIIGKAACEGLKIFWKQWRSPPRSSNPNVIYHASIIALIGLETAVRDGLDITSISPDEAKIAAEHAMYELNDFPSWMPALTKAHPEVVRQVFHPQIEAEFNFPAAAEGPHGLLSKLSYEEPDEVRHVSAPDLLDLLKHGDPANLMVLSFVLNIMARSGPDFLLELSLMAPTRTTAAARGKEEHFVQWLALWLKLDALPALNFIESHLTAYPADADGFVVELADSLFGDRHGNVSIPDPDYRRLPTLRRLIPILCRYIRTKDDLVHEGVYSPGARDDAQRFRDMAINRLVNTPEDHVYDAIKELVDDPALAGHRNWLLAKAIERAKTDAEPSPWEPKDIAAFVDRFERPPKTPDELFDIVMGRLDDIREGAEQGDFSLKGMFAENTEEELFQKLLADRLNIASRGVYQVAREIEVAEHKRPDIRVLRTGAGIVTIEVKVANKWSYNQLRNDALEGQLVKQYMRIRESRHGVLLLVNLKAGRKWKLSGEPGINFADLIKRLGEKSEKLAKSRRREEKIKVVGIDLAT